MLNLSSQLLKGERAVALGKSLNVLRKRQSGKFNIRGGGNKPHGHSGLASGAIQRSFSHCLFSLLPFVHLFSYFENWLEPPSST